MALSLYVSVCVMAPVVKNLLADAGDTRHGFVPWVRKIPWSRKWQILPWFLPGKFHRQRTLVGYSSCDQKDSDMTEHAHTHVYLHIMTLHGTQSCSSFFSWSSTFQAYYLLWDLLISLISLMLNLLLCKMGNKKITDPMGLLWGINVLIHVKSLDQRQHTVSPVEH